MEVLQSKYNRLCAVYKKEANNRYNRLVDDIPRILESKSNSESDLTGCLQKQNGNSPPLTVCPECGRADRKTDKQFIPKEDHIPRLEIEDLSNDPRRALDCFTEALTKWSNPDFRHQISETTYLKSIEKSQLRIAELESQLCDLSLQHQMERKRRLLSSDALQRQSECAEENNDGKSIDTEEHITRTCDAEKQLLLKFMQDRIQSANTLAQCAMARAHMMEGELRALTPHLKHVAKELTEVRENCVKQAEAYSAYQLDMLDKKNGLAIHLTHLTNEVQRLRADKAS